MFEEKYIMTGIVTMLLVAAWQKPSLYKEQLSNKVMFTSMIALLLFMFWEFALTTAVNSLPEMDNSKLKETIMDAIKSNSIAGVWWGFALFVYLGSFALDWPANVSLQHDKANKAIKSSDA